MMAELTKKKTGPVTHHWVKGPVLLGLEVDYAVHGAVITGPAGCPNS